MYPDKQLHTALDNIENLQPSSSIATQDNIVEDDQDIAQS